VYQDSSTSLIWSNQTGENKLVVGTDNGDPSDDQPTVLGLALDSSHLYWSAWDTSRTGQLAHVRSSPRAGGAIVEANLPTPGVGEIVLAHGSLWFANWKQAGGHVYSLPAPFVSDAAPTDQSGADVPSSLHLASNDAFVFYDESTVATHTDQDEIGAVSTTLGGPDEVAFSLTHIEDLAVDAENRVYYAQTSAGKIGSAIRGGDASVTPFVSIPYPHFLAYDGDNSFLYVISTTAANVYSLQRFSTNSGANPAPQMCVDNLTDADALFYFGGHVYFSARSASGSALFDLKTN
ncbi:MAG: hypothetical protein ABI461_20795, partial [Polyangiaceae bacterium]